MGAGYHGGFGATQGSKKQAVAKLGSKNDRVKDYTREELVRGIDGITEDASFIADMIRNKKIKINVLGDRLFEDYLGVSSDTLAVAVGDQIYLRRISISILSEIVHEGTHALDFINKIDVNVISSWTGETRAYSAERKFQIASGGPVDFEKEEDMMTHIMKNYKRR